MLDPKKIEQIARQIHHAMPKGVKEFGDDVEKKTAYCFAISVKQAGSRQSGRI